MSDTPENIVIIGSGPAGFIEINAHSLTFRGQAAVLVAAIDVTDRVEAEEGGVE